LRSLYICYLALSDPLVETQVVAYLVGLAERGHHIHLLTFETEERDEESRQALNRRLASRGITWHSLRYHKRPSLPATAYDVLRGGLEAARLVRKYRLEVIHARVHVAAAMALFARRLTGCRLIFDVRGLMAEEYVDAGRWRQGGVPWRLTKWVERRALAAADWCVVLTPVAGELLLGDRPDNRITVIPCCANLELLERGRAERDVVRAELGLGDRTVLAYCGKFGGWYMERAMVDFFVVAHGEIEDLHFLVLTQDDRVPIEACFRNADVEPDAYTVTGFPPERMGAALAAADVGISFIAPFPSKVASSPTKVGEYLGAGLPIVATSGVPAVDELLSEPGVGVLVTDRSSDGYRRAAHETSALLEDGKTSSRCVRLAQERLSLQGLGIPRYNDVYEHVARAAGHHRAAQAPSSS
jgi:glycosyltransferase involved in cell wall biosynthesis